MSFGDGITFFIYYIMEFTASMNNKCKLIKYIKQ